MAIARHVTWSWAAALLAVAFMFGCATADTDDAVLHRSQRGEHTEQAAPATVGAAPMVAESSRGAAFAVTDGVNRCDAGGWFDGEGIAEMEKCVQLKKQPCNCIDELALLVADVRASKCFCDK